MAKSIKKAFIIGTLLSSFFLSITACNVGPFSKPNTISSSDIISSNDDLDVISISASSNKASFDYGEELDITVTALYSDGSTANVSDYQVSGYNATNPGEQTVTVSYKDKTCVLTVTVNDPVLVSVTAVSNKESYEWGEDLDITVIATYSDGSTVEVTNYSVEGYDPENPGLQNVVISYDGKNCDLTVSVSERKNLFPANELNSFLQSEGIQTTIPSPIGYNDWENTVDLYEDGSNYFVSSTEDKGRTGVNTISDQYAVLLRNNDWDVTSSGIGFTASKVDGDALLRFKTENELFSMSVESYVEFPDKALSGTLVNSKNSLKVGTKVIFGNISNQFLASSLNNDGLLETSNCSFVNNSPIKVDKNIVRFTLERKDSYWTFKDARGRLLGATGVGSLAWDEGSTEWTIVFSSGSAVIINANKNYGRLYFNQETGCLCTYTNSIGRTLLYPQIFSLAETDLIYASDISVSGKSTLGMGKTTKLSLDYVPYNTNAFSDVTWSSSDENVATVKDGVITGVSVGNAVITAKTRSKNSNLETSFNIEVKEIALDSWTIMLYICGADLESGSGLASADIAEILSVNGQPDDVNIIIETGGASYWQRYGISSSVLSRYHVENKSLVLDATLPNASMGKQATFESFLNWGLQEYPAENTGVVFWNHGGALDGVCFDENFYSDSLLNSETSAAFANVFAENGIDKLEFVGYDACLMQVQDVAEFNSHYFNYMIGSEESEVGEGWVYSGWIDDVYAGKNTREILQANCDSFVDRYGSDQTLSYLDLSKMNNYLTKFEAMAAAIKNTVKSNYGSFKSLLNGVKSFGDDWWSSGMDDFGTIDGLDMLNKISNNSKYNGFQSQINEVKAAFNQLVVYSRKGSSAGNANGLIVIAGFSINYNSSETHFSTWRSLFN